MNRKVTPPQIDKLYDFCQNHFVYHYDLQVELVDHLASAIEDKWESNPEVSFGEALNDIYKKFGVYGFGKIKEQKKKELRRKYNRILWKYFVEFYRWPKVLMTFAFTSFVFTVFQVVENSLIVFYTFFALLISYVLVYFFIEAPKLKIKAKKKFLLIDYLNGLQGTVIIIASQLPNIVFQLAFATNKIVIDNFLLLFGCSLTIVACGILLYGQTFVIPRKVKQHFLEAYSEYVM